MTRYSKHGSSHFPSSSVLPKPFCPSTTLHALPLHSCCCFSPPPPNPLVNNQSPTTFCASWKIVCILRPLWSGFFFSSTAILILVQMWEADAENCLANPPPPPINFIASSKTQNWGVCDSYLGLLATLLQSNFLLCLNSFPRHFVSALLQRECYAASRQVLTSPMAFEVWKHWGWWKLGAGLNPGVTVVSVPIIGLLTW